MKKSFLLIYLLSIALFYGYSQTNLVLSDSTGPVPNGSVKVLHGLPSDLSIDTYMFIKNTSDAAIPVKVKKVEVSVVEGASNYFCWGLCFGSLIYVSPNAITIDAGATNSFDFSGHFSPSGQVGLSVLRYVFFNSTNTLDSAYYEVWYDTRPLTVQNLSLADSTGTVRNDTTITVSGSPSDLSLDTYMFVKNNSTDSIPVKVKKVEISTIHGTQNYFCWGQCFQSTVFVSPQAIYIHGSSTNFNDFSAHYSPNDSAGITTVRYVFFDANNPSDSVCYNVKYDTKPQAVETILPKDSPMLACYPNPANAFTNIGYNIPQGSTAILVIRNLLGTVVKEEPIHQASGKFIIKTNDLANGIYFCSILDNGQPVVTKKLTVQH